jgi:diguanylate cyclase (GGDEF)-like protein
VKVLRPTTVRNSANRRLEGGLAAPIIGRPEFLSSRMVALVLAGAISWLAFDHPAAGRVAVVLVIASVLSPVTSRIPPRTHVGEYQAMSDLVVIGFLLSAAPELWPMALIWIGTNQAWHALTSPPRTSLLISGASLLTMSFIGHQQSIEMWPFAVITGLLLSAAFTIYGSTLRQEIWDQESALTEALSAAGAVVHHSDLHRGTVVRIEGDLHGLTGWTTEEWGSIDHRHFIHPDDLAHYWVELDQVEPNTVLDRLARMRRKDGSYLWMRDVALVNEDARGHRTLRGFSLDVSDLEESNARSARQLREDTLTGLPNRLALNERISELLASDIDFALMISDLDRFKEVNDTLGHEAGDQLLQIIAGRLAGAVRPGDLVARLGGDEYAVVLVNDVDEAEVVTIANRLSTACAQPVPLNGVAVAIASSIGVALRSRSGRDRATMLRHADIAMYEAKRSSESFRVFDASLEQTSTLRLTLSGALAAAIEDGELTVFFQPKYDMTTRRLVGAESLARWQHPQFGLLTPATFLDIALMSETALPFALSTVRGAASMVRRLQDAGTTMPIAANVAMRALRDPGFAPAVLALLAELDVPPSLLVLELTESDPLWPNLHSVLGLEALLEAGVQISIDDFGTGHSSLERLRALRVHELKIDRSFVNGMTSDPLQRQLVHTIVDLAGRLGYRIVAEGVETEEQVDVLLGFGCTMAQGYLFAKPMPAADFFELARAEALEAVPLDA